MIRFIVTFFVKLQEKFDFKGLMFTILFVVGLYHIWDLWLEKSFDKYYKMAYYGTGPVPLYLFQAIEVVFEISFFILIGLFVFVIRSVLKMKKKFTSDDVFDKINSLTDTLIDRDKALSDSEKRFREMAEMLPEVIVEIDKHGNITYTNQLGYEITGYTKDDIKKGLNIFALVDHSERQRVTSNFDALLKGIDPGPKDLKIIKKDGTVIPTLARTATIKKNEEIIGYRATITDITEKVLAEYKLKKSEETHRLLTENSKDVIWTMEWPSLKVNYISPTITKAFGYTIDSILSVPMVHRYPEEDYRKIKETFHSIANKIQSRTNADYTIPNFVVRMYNSDRELVWVEISGNFLVDHEGIILKIQGSTRNVNDRILSEIKLKESEELFRTLYANAYDAILRIEKETIIGCNKKALTMFNCDKDFLIGKDVYQISADTQLDGVSAKSMSRSYLTAAYDGDAFEFDWVHRRQDGSLFDTKVSLSEIKVNQKTYIQAVIRDISKLKEAQSKLEQREKRFRALVETTPDIIWETNTKFEFLYCSPQIEITGFSQKDIVGTTVEFVFSRVPDKYRKQIADAMVELRTTKEPFTNFQAIVIHKKGYEMYLEISGVPLFDKKGKYSGYRGVARDVTDQKKQQLELASQVALERVLHTVSAKFIQLDHNQLDDGIREALKFIGIHLNVEWGGFFEVFGEHPKFGNTKFVTCTHEWCRDNYPSQLLSLHNLEIDLFPKWFAPSMRNLEVMAISEITELPPEAVEEINFIKQFQNPNLQSAIIVPIGKNNECIGSFRFDSNNPGITWEEGKVRLLKTLGEILCNVIERKRLGEEILAKEHIYRTLFDRSGAAVILVNAKDIIVQANQKVYEMGGYKEPEVVGKSWRSFVSGLDIKRLERYIQSHLEEGEFIPDYECKFIMKSGELKNILCTIGFTDNKAELICSFIDITPRIKINEALRIGSILESQKLITGEQLKEALELQKETGAKLGDILRDDYNVPEREVNDALMIQAGVMDKVLLT